MLMSLRAKSFDVLPALSVGGRELRSSLRLVTVAWMFGIVWMSSITGSAMTSFLRLLGFEEYEFGIFAAIPYAATLSQLYAAAYVERTGVRKWHFIYYAVVHRLMWLVLAAVPLVLGSGKPVAYTFLGLYLFSVVLAHVSTPSWWNWMGNLIPRRIRGRYFSVRTLWTVPIQMLVVTTVGFILDQVTTPNVKIRIDTQPPALLWTISAIFAAGAICGTIDILLFLRLREIATPSISQTEAPQRGTLHNLYRSLVEPVRSVATAFRNRVFRHYALYGATILFSQIVCDQFFWLHAREKVGFSNLQTNVVFMVIGAAAAMAMARPWGRLIDRWGRRPVLFLATLGVTFSTVPWFLMVPGREHLVGNFALASLACIVGGSSWSGVGLAQTTVMIGFSESEGRTRYMAAAAVVAAMGGFLGGLAGGFISSTFKNLFADWGIPGFQVGPFLWNQYHMTFLASSIMRALAILWLIGMPDPGAKPIADVMRYIRVNVYSNVKTLLLGTFRPFLRPGDED